MQSTITNLNQRVGEHLKHVTIYTACRISRIIYLPLKQSILQTLLQLVDISCINIGVKIVYMRPIILYSYTVKVLHLCDSKKNTGLLFATIIILMLPKNPIGAGFAISLSFIKCNTQRYWVMIILLSFFHF